MEAQASGRAWRLWLYSRSQAQAGYMEEMHGDWLRVPFDSPLRDALKQQCATPVVVWVVVRFMAALKQQ